MSAGLLLAGCGQPGFLPVDPMTPLISPSLAGCEWHVPNENEDITDGYYVERYDELGRQTESDWSTEHQDGTFNQIRTVRRWKGACVVRADRHTLSVFPDGNTFEGTLAEEWECDAHDQPTRYGFSSTTTNNGEDGNSMFGEGFFVNSYDRDLLTKVVYVDEDGRPTGTETTLEWKRRRVVSAVTTDEIGEATRDILGEEDTTLVSRESWDWKGDRMLTHRATSEQPYETEVEETHVYDGRTWLGTDTVVHIETGTRRAEMRWEWGDGRFPVGVTSIHADGAVSHTEFRITCRDR